MELTKFEANQDKILRMLQHTSLSKHWLYFFIFRCGVLYFYSLTLNVLLEMKKITYVLLPRLGTVLVNLRQLFDIHTPYMKMKTFGYPV